MMRNEMQQLEMRAVWVWQRHKLKPVCCLSVNIVLSLSWNVGLAGENKQILCDIDEISSSVMGTSGISFSPKFPRH